MTTRRAAIIILIGAAIIWAPVLLLFGYLFFPYGLLVTIIVPTIWLLTIRKAGLVSLRVLAWAFILIGVFLLFFFPLALSGLSDVIPEILVYLILIFIGINFAFGVLTAIISFFKEKKALTTKE